MSSDSEDDLYTNTASLFTKITHNIIKENVDQSYKDDESFIINETKSDGTPDIIFVPHSKKRLSSKIRKKNVELTNGDTNDTTQMNKETSFVNLDESVDVIEQINACLERNQRSRGRRKSRVTLRRTTRNSTKKSKKTPQVIANIDIDVDYPLSNSSNFNPNNLGEEITLKVLWKSQSYKKFETNKNQKLDIIFTYYAEKEKVSEEMLYFYVNDTIVCKTDTPESLNLNAASIIEGGILNTKTHISSGYKNDTIKLKVQWKDLKRPFIYDMKVTDSMSVMMEECSKQLKIPVAKLKFYFDGDEIKHCDSASSLELEGGECIDCIQK